MTKQVVKFNKNKNNKQKAKPTNSEITGLGRIIRSLGIAAGGSLGALTGNPFGVAAGAYIGREVAAQGSKFLGQGAYKMNQNTLWRSGQQVPVMHSSNNSFRIRHKEYLCDIVGSTAYAVQQSFNVNPGLDATFPYLSAIAGNFQEYRIKGLVYTYKATSGDSLASTNTALGSVMMVAQYRSDLPAPLNKALFLNEHWSVDSSPSCDMYLPVECSPKENPMSIQYLRSGPLSANQDVKLYDIATVHIATQGMQSTGNTIGELWVSYDIEFFKPALSTSSNLFGADLAHYTLTAMTTASPLGTATKRIDTIGTTLNGQSISFPTGPNVGASYMVVYANNSTATTVPGYSTGSGCNVRQIWRNNTTSYASAYNSTDNMLSLLVTVTAGANAFVTISYGSLTSATLGDLYITNVPAEYS